MTEPVLLLGDELVAAERRRNVHVIVRLNGRYVLANKRDIQGKRREFACRALHISPHAATLAVPVIGNTGERVIAHVDGLGKLQGSITHMLNGGFVLSIAATPEEREKLTDRIEWLERNKKDDRSISARRNVFCRGTRTPDCSLPTGRSCPVS